jgi:hypothetical protein
MKMKIVILEDRPLVMMKSIKQMKEMGIDTERIIFFDAEKENHENERAAEYRKTLETRCKEMDIQLSIVNNCDFETTLDELYKDPDIIFFFDMDLVGDYSQHFVERINVIYALKKKEQEKNEGRIWFYTTGPRSAIEQINDNFSNRNIPVKEYDTQNDLTILDFDFIKDHILE